MPAGHTRGDRSWVAEQWPRNAERRQKRTRDELRGPKTGRRRWRMQAAAIRRLILSSRENAPIQSGRFTRED
ncbi:hypothetical protein RBSH_04658 [Rhodopirellula baltica SH28]|uniref:Uncharacterized protein n=1 Tax=Rhodopirellula baltica SH28 TaxID=993517 RepID=K5C9V2_RHOBT|nr:hypothetical protein RBSH_04658 [Rhodopirellula baltica SH28]